MLKLVEMLKIKTCSTVSSNHARWYVILDPMADCVPYSWLESGDI